MGRLSAGALLWATFQLVPVPAIAQSAHQTPENAQRFLATVRGQIALASPIDDPSPYVLQPIDFLFLDSPSSCATRYGHPGSASVGHLPWRDIVEVKQEEGATRVWLTQSNRQRQFLIFASPSLAARAAYAMEFLRQHCDPAASTGF